ncbi:unnamed protein product [Scytosiphon promiscuus]
MQVERQEIERKHGLSASAGSGSVVGDKRPSVQPSCDKGDASCKGIESIDEANQPPRKRVKRGTFSVDLMPLLLRMNALSNEKVVEMKLVPGKSYPRRTLENCMYHVSTFGGLCKDQVREYMVAHVGEDDSSRSDVLQFYELFPVRKKEKIVRDIVGRQKQEGRSEWSYWFCKGCTKVECVCDSQNM